MVDRVFAIVIPSASTGDAGGQLAPPSPSESELAHLRELSAVACANVASVLREHHRSVCEKVAATAERTTGEPRRLCALPLSRALRLLSDLSFFCSRAGR